MLMIIFASSYLILEKQYKVAASDRKNTMKSQEWFKKNLHSMNEISKDIHSKIDEKKIFKKDSKSTGNDGSDNDFSIDEKQDDSEKTSPFGEKTDEK